MIDATDRAELSENAEAKHPIDPIERADPIDPIDSTEPLEAIDRNESSDHSDHFEVPAGAPTEAHPSRPGTCDCPRCARGDRVTLARVSEDFAGVSEDFARAVEFPAGTRTAADAAAAIGCQVGQIVKSLVFRAGADGPAVLVLCSGANTVDAVRLGLVKADADFVRAVTGFAIGGVPPWGWATPPARTMIDRDLLRYEEIWAAAGTPRSVFPLAPSELVARTGGELTAVSPS